jgi:hypothetical protein
MEVWNIYKLTTFLALDCTASSVAYYFIPFGNDTELLYDVISPYVESHLLFKTNFQSRQVDLIHFNNKIENTLSQLSSSISNFPFEEISNLFLLPHFNVSSNIFISESFNNLDLIETLYLYLSFLKEKISMKSDDIIVQLNASNFSHISNFSDDIETELFNILSFISNEGSKKLLMLHQSTFEVSIYILVSFYILSIFSFFFLRFFLRKSLNLYFIVYFFFQNSLSKK